MEKREREALDRHITGNYGEDQFRDEVEVVRFENGRCIVDSMELEVGSFSLEAPLEAFGQCKLTSAFNELNRQAVLKLCRAVGLETLDGMPYDELRWTAVSMLQYAWFEQIPGGVPKSVRENYEERMTHYQSVLERVKRGEVMTGEQVAAGGTETTKKAKSPKEPKPNVNYTYSLSTNALSDRLTKGIANEQTTNHDFIIVAILQGHVGQMTLEDLTKAVYNTGRYETKDPLPKSIRWHLLKMEKEGVVIAHELRVDAPQPVVDVKPKQVPPPVVGTKSAKTTQTSAVRESGSKNAQAAKS